MTKRCPNCGSFMQVLKEYDRFKSLQCHRCKIESTELKEEWEFTKGRHYGKNY